MLSAEDVNALQHISEVTFRDTFSADNLTEDLEEYIRLNLSCEKLSRELANPDSLFVFAERDAVPLGFLKLNVASAQTEDRGPDAVELERIYVLREAQGLGIGSFLLHWALTWAKARSATELWLGVWEHNIQALKFYFHHGFESVGSHVFMFGSDPQTDLILSRRIDSDHSRSLK